MPPRSSPPRSKSDEAIRACAARGGVIGALAFPAMLTQTLPAVLDDYLDTIDYLTGVAGIDLDHVGIGPDFMEAMPQEVAETVLAGLPLEVITFPPVQGFASVADLPNVTAGLLARGYSAADTQKIMGGNWLRLYGQVWKS
jgi:membrane dipeptidase